MALVENGIQSAIGIFLEEIEIRRIVFDAVAVKIPENTQAGLLIDKQEAAEVGIELLNPGARRNEIVIGAQVMKFYFHESFL